MSSETCLSGSSLLNFYLKLLILFDPEVATGGHHDGARQPPHRRGLFANSPDIVVEPSRMFQDAGSGTLATGAHGSERRT